jgi:hypothetical protein
MAGWINWALNIYPLLQPGLSMLYSKMSGKSESLKPIWINTTMVCELHWFTDHIECSDEVHILDSTEWSADDANLTAYTDACMTGLGFWIPQDNVGFASPVTTPHGIFFLEAWKVLAAIHHVCINGGHHTPACLAIFCDNSNTNMFNTLCASPDMNGILLTTVNLAIEYNCAFCVFHIAGDANTITNTLSHADWATITSILLLLRVNSFQSPPVRLGHVL